MIRARRSPAASRVWLCALPAAAQSIAIEGTHSAGASSEELTAVGTQVRVFGDAGETLRGLRFQIEGSWGWRSDDEGDFFGTAYPYGGAGRSDGGLRRVRGRATAGWVRAVKGGRYRTPFGIYAAERPRVHRVPAARRSSATANTTRCRTCISNRVRTSSIGKPRLSVEGASGLPAMSARPSGGRARQPWSAPRPCWRVDPGRQLHRHDAVPCPRGSRPAERALAAWTCAGCPMVYWLRGEWLGGQPFEGTRTTGGYADLLVHRPTMGPVTAFGPRRAAGLRRHSAVCALHASLHRRRAHPVVAHRCALHRRGPPGAAS